MSSAFTFHKCLTQMAQWQTPEELDQQMGLLGRASPPAWYTVYPRAWLGRRTGKRLLQLMECPVLT